MHKKNMIALRTNIISGIVNTFETGNVILCYFKICS